MQTQGSVHDGPFNNLPMTAADRHPLLANFDALWSDKRYTRRRTVEEAATRRCACQHFYDTANDMLHGVLDREMPSGVKRNADGCIASSDIVRHVDYFRTVLARLDAE